MAAPIAAMKPKSLNPAQTDWQASSPWVSFGNRTVYGLLGGTILFMALVSISGAVVAQGTVGVEGNYKTVQNLEGGVVAKILVQNGDRVKKDDPLVILSAGDAQSNLAVTTGRVTDLMIQEARLEAERDNQGSFSLPAGLKASDGAVEKIFMSQQALFKARRASHLGELSVLGQRLQQVKGEFAANEAQTSSMQRQRDITAKELGNVTPLFERGFVNQQRLTSLQRESARIDGEMGRLSADLAKAKSAVSETELRLAQVNKDYTSQVTDELRKVQAGLAEQRETMTGLTTKVARSEVRAPHDGRVHALAVHTIGGVIQPGAAILQIIPENEPMVVDAQLQPNAIDKVHEGQMAAVRFPAFNSKTTPRLEGTVINVSPAQVTDSQGRTFFTVQVRIAQSELIRLGSGHTLLPGMPAEVYIETSDRSMLSYLTKPLVDAMFSAFREG